MIGIEQQYPDRRQANNITLKLYTEKIIHSI